MDVTLAMLSKVLEPYLLPGSTLPNSTAVVQAIREAGSDEVSEAEPGILSVVDQGGRTALAYAEGSEGAWRLERLVSTAPGAHDLLGQLHDEVSVLQSWGDRVLRSAFDGEPLEQTIQIASEMLENPIALFDLSIGTLCYAGIAPDAPMAGSMWETITRMESPFDKCDDEMQRFFIRALDSATGPFVFDSSKTFNEAFNEDEFMICPVFNEGGLCSLLGSTSINVPFSARELALVSYLQYVFGGHRAWRQDGQSGEAPAPKTVAALLRGKPVRRALLNRSLMGLGWRSDVPYRVLRFPLGEDLSKLQVSDAMIHVRACLPKSMVLTWEGDCLCIAREEAYGDAASRGALEALAGRLERSVGVSGPQSDLMMLLPASLQAKEALLAAQAGHGSGVMAFDKCCGQRVGERISAAADPRAFCELRLLAAYGEGALDSEQLRTLRTYLECGRNASRAAEELYIHRNTMFYRISRIEKALGQTIEDLISEVGFEVLYLTCVLLDGASVAL